MEMKETMTFAPGWTQVIDRSDEGQERVDLAGYISDTFKAINGFRPRWWDLREWSVEDLRAEATSLEDEVVASINRSKVEAHERMLEANREALIHRNAKKRVSPTHKPFANLKEMLV